MVSWTDFALPVAPYEQNYDPSFYLIGMILYIVLFLLGFATMIFAYRQFKRKNMLNNLAYSLLGVFVGFQLVNLNQAILRLSMFLSEGKWGFFYLSRAMFYTIGFLLLIVCFAYFASGIVNLPASRKKYFTWIIWIQIIILVYGMVVMVLAHAGVFSTIEEELHLIGPVLILGVILYGLIAIFFYFESRQNPSAMIRGRLKLLLLTMLAVTLDLGVVSLPFLGRQLGTDYPGCEVIGFIHIVVMPWLSLIFGIIFYLMLYWSIFMPIWLQEFLGVMPPSFKSLMLKKQKLAAKP